MLLAKVPSLHLSWLITRPWRSRFPCCGFLKVGEKKNQGQPFFFSTCSQESHPLSRRIANIWGVEMSRSELTQRVLGPFQPT